MSASAVDGIATGEVAGLRIGRSMIVVPAMPSFGATACHNSS